MNDLGRFTVIAPSISLFQPESFTPTSHTILMLTWMNASDRNIIFYVRKYAKICPTARLILLRGTPANMIYRSEATQTTNLAPVIHALLSEPTSAVFAHLFSNSGAQQMGLLLRAFRKFTGSRLELLGLVLDSSPAMGTFGSAFDGLVYQVPKTHWWVRIPGIAVIFLIVTVVGGIEKVTGNLNVLAQANADLVNEDILSTDVPRWYMYSMEDMLVKRDEIEWHARMAEDKGWKVEKVQFETSEHCQHARGVGEEKYWKIIDGAVNGVARVSKL